MIDIDMNRPDRDLSPGIDLWEVAKAEATTSAGQVPMLSVAFFRCSDPGQRMYDNVMLAGNGWGIGKSKLVALGVAADFKGKLDPLDFVGRRVWLSTGVDVYQGKARLKVLIADLKHSGYQPADMVPEGCTAPAVASDDADSLPF